MDKHDVVVTGVGMIGPLGCSASDFSRGWREGRCAETAALPELAGTLVENNIAALLPAYDAARRLGGRRMLKFMSEASVLGCIAAQEALREADAISRFPAEHIGLYAGTGLAAANVNDVRAMVEQSIDEDGFFSCRLFGERGLAATNPLLSFKILANMPPCLISVMEGIKGPSMIFTPWEGQTASAMAEGWRAVSSGQVACAVVGASDTAAYPSTLVYLRQSGHLRKEDYPASGAAYLVLERAESALKHGVRPYVRIKDIKLAYSPDISDPLAARIGRTYAAAPALLLGIACHCGWKDLSICGEDHQECRIDLETLQ